MATCHFKFSAAHSWHYVHDAPSEFMSAELITQTRHRCDLYPDPSHSSRCSCFKTKQLSSSSSIDHCYSPNTATNGSCFLWFKHIGCETIPPHTNRGQNITRAVADVVLSCPVCHSPSVKLWSDRSDWGKLNPSRNHTGRTQELEAGLSTEYGEICSLSFHQEREVGKG